MSKPWLKLVVLAFAFVAAGCSADAGDGQSGPTAAVRDPTRVGEPCFAGASPPDPECSGPDWTCVPTGQCVPAKACASHEDCGCYGPPSLCVAACDPETSRCARNCSWDRFICKGTSRCAPRNDLVAASLCK